MARCAVLASREYPYLKGLNQGSRCAQAVEKRTFNVPNPLRVHE